MEWVWVSVPPRKEWISRGVERYGHAAVFTPSFNRFRFYNDGTESGSSPWANDDGNITVRVGAGDRKVHLRVRIQETGGANGAATDDWQLQVSKNAGAYANVTAASSNVKADTLSSLTDGSATTNRATNGITDGTGAFVAGVQEEGDGQIANHQLTASNFTEHVFALTLVAADLANNDTLDFRISLNGGAPGMTNAVTPRITVNKATAIDLVFKRGSYTGDGGASQAISGLGFAPKLLFIKEAAGTPLRVRTNTMATDSVKTFPDDASGFQLNYIESMDSDGFTVGSNLNTNLETYFWAAFGGDVNEIVSFSYTGTGVDGQFIDCGFTPDFALILLDATGGVRWRTSDISGDNSLIPASTLEANNIQAIETGGIQLGTGGQVNTNGTTYYLVAMKDRTGVMKTHTYTGDGLDGRDALGAGFQPQFALVKGNNVSIAHIRFGDQTGDNSFPVTSFDQLTDRIQDFLSDGMDLGTDAGVNANTVAYYVLWAKPPALTHQAAAVLATTATFSPAAILNPAVAASALLGSVSLSPAASATYVALAALTGTATLAGNETLSLAAQAAFNASAVLAALAVMNLSAVFAGSATAILAALATATYSAATLLETVALLNATASSPFLQADASLTGVASLSPAASLTASAAAVLATTATLVAQAGVTYAIAAAMSGIATLAAADAITLAAAAVLDTTATLAAVPNLTLGASASLTATALLEAIALLKQLSYIFIDASNLPLLEGSAEYRALLEVGAVLLARIEGVAESLQTIAGDAGASTVILAEGERS